MPPLPGLETQLAEGNYKYAAPLELQSLPPYVKEHNVYNT
jgi:hypothetical protein